MAEHAQKTLREKNDHVVIVEQRLANKGTQNIVIHFHAKCSMRLLISLYTKYKSKANR